MGVRGEDHVPMALLTVSGLTVSGLTVTRGRKKVLSGGNASSPSPGIVVCTGPNGSGKTTLLEVIAGLLPAAGGEVSHGLTPVSLESEEWRKNVSYLPSDGGSIPLLTCAEQLKLVLELTGVGRSESRRRIDTLAEVYGLGPHLHNRAGTLSHGTRKRLGLAIVAASPAPIVLLDEPSAGLDLDGVGILIATVELMRRSGATVVLTSHTAGTFASVMDVRWRIEPCEDGARLAVGDESDPATSVDGGSGDHRDPLELPWLWSG